MARNDFADGKNYRRESFGEEENGASGKVARASCPSGNPRLCTEADAGDRV